MSFLTTVQQSIAQWGRETFGTPGVEPPTQKIATRMNVETAELLLALAELRDLPPGLDHEVQKEACADECADVFIMLMQVADGLNIDLGDRVGRKMEINRRRVWGRTSSGKVQHVEPPLPAASLRDLCPGSPEGHRWDSLGYCLVCGELNRQKQRVPA